MYFKDENILSFLFRTQVIYGCFNFSNLFSQNGKIKMGINIQKELLPVYRLYNEKKLYELLGKTYTAEVEFCTPYKKLYSLGNLLNREKVYCYMVNYVSFNFCIECIEESYKAHGVGYLKQEWFRSGYCNKHKIPLYFVPIRSFSDSIDNMMKLMAGIRPHPHNYRPITERDSFTSVSKHKNQDITSTVYIKPCVEKLFIEWINEHNDILLSTIQPKGCNYSKSYLLKSVLRHERDYFKIFYLNRHSNNFISFNEFLSKKTRIIIEKHGAIQEDSFSDSVMKNASTNCLTCDINLSSLACKMRHKNIR